MSPFRGLSPSLVRNEWSMWTGMGGRCALEYAIRGIKIVFLSEWASPQRRRMAKAKGGEAATSPSLYLGFRA